jgi:V-type H+-transporting ATPase subunit C
MWSATVGAHDYVANHFKWDVNAWGDRDEPLPDVLRRLTAAADKVDADVRAAAQAYQEKKTALQAAERKRSGNLMVCALEDVVTPQALAAAGSEWAPADSDYLASVVLVVQKPQEEAFLAGYAQLDGASVPLGPEGRRDAVRGSPVVPGSARRVAEDKDGYVLYVLLTLKKFGESFRAACREKRLAVRDFALDPAQAGAAARQVAQLQKELTERLAVLKSESRRKYKEALSLTLHVKALRVFVESVLRFGLPVAFTAVIIKLKRNKAPGAGAENALNAARLLEGVRATWKRVAKDRNHSAVQAAYDLSGAGAAKSAAQGGGADPVIAGVSDAAGGAANANPFVLLDFEVKEDTGPIASKGT